MGYSDACGGTGAPGAARYTGPGPHAVDFEGTSDFYQANTDVVDNGGTLLAKTSRHVEPAGWAPASAARVQLVACVVPHFTIARVGSCRYRSIASSKVSHDALDRARYTLTLYVARTGKKLTGPVTVTGSDRTCPASVLAFSGDQNPAVYTSLSRKQIKAVIGKYVQ